MSRHTSIIPNLSSRDDREWLFTFPFPPIPMQSIHISSHFHSQFCNQFPFPWDSHWAFPIPSHSHSRTIVSLLRHEHFLAYQRLKSNTHTISSVCVLCLSLNLKTCQDRHHYWTSQTTENICWIVFDFDEKQYLSFSSQNISQTLHFYIGMRIYSHGNKGHFHSHTGCFPFLPILISNFVINSHSREIPMGFPFPLGIPFPWSSLLTRDVTNVGIVGRVAELKRFWWRYCRVNELRETLTETCSSTEQIWLSKVRYVKSYKTAFVLNIIW